MRKMIKLCISVMLILSLNVSVYAETTYRNDIRLSIPETGFLRNMLPGESSNISATSLEKINNENDFSVIVCVDFFAGTKGYVNANHPYFEAYRFRNDYDYYSEPGKVSFNGRLKQVIDIKMKEGNDWIESDGKFYTLVVAEETKELNDITFSLLPELGGSLRNRKTSYPERTIQRPWEQGASFDLGYEVVVINADEDAVKENFGDKVLEDINEKSDGDWFN